MGIETEVVQFATTGINWNLFWIIMTMLFILFAIGIMVLVIFFARKFNYTVQVIERRGHNDKIIWYDWGRILEVDQGCYKLHLLKARKQISMTEFKNTTILNGNILHKQQVTVYRSSAGTWSFADIDVNNDKLEGKIIDNKIDRYFAIISEQEEKFKKKKGWEYWVAMATPIVSLILMIVFIIIITKSLSNLVGGMGTVAAAFSGAADKLSQCVVAPAHLI